MTATSASAPPPVSDWAAPPPLDEGGASLLVTGHSRHPAGLVWPYRSWRPHTAAGSCLWRHTCPAAHRSGYAGELQVTSLNRRFAASHTLSSRNVFLVQFNTGPAIDVVASRAGSPQCVQTLGQGAQPGLFTPVAHCSVSLQSLHRQCLTVQTPTSCNSKLRHATCCFANKPSSQVSCLAWSP